MRIFGSLFLMIMLFSCTENSTDKSSSVQQVSAVFPASNYNELMSSDKPMFIDFNTTWCGPCKLMKPMFEDLAIQYQGMVNFI